MGILTEVGGICRKNCLFFASLFFCLFVGFSIIKTMLLLRTNSHESKHGVASTSHPFKFFATAPSSFLIVFLEIFFYERFSLGFDNVIHSQIIFL